MNGINRIGLRSCPSCSSCLNNSSAQRFGERRQRLGLRDEKQPVLSEANSALKVGWLLFPTLDIGVIGCKSPLRYWDSSGVQNTKWSLLLEKYQVKATAEGRLAVGRKPANVCVSAGLKSPPTAISPKQAAQRHKTYPLLPRTRFTSSSITLSHAVHCPSDAALSS
jgi:hypothetical protein